MFPLHSIVSRRLAIAATLVPTIALTSVDLPTFGRPATAMNPDLVSAAPASCDSTSP